MAENKSVPSGGNVQDFLAAVEHPVPRSDGYPLLALMEAVTDQPSVMWAPASSASASTAQDRSRMLVHQQLDDVDPAVLEQLVRTGYEFVMTELHTPPPRPARFHLTAMLPEPYCR